MTEAVSKFKSVSLAAALAIGLLVVVSIGVLLITGNLPLPVTFGVIAIGGMLCLVVVIVSIVCLVSAPKSSQKRPASAASTPAVSAETSSKAVHELRQAAMIAGCLLISTAGTSLTWFPKLLFQQMKEPPGLLRDLTLVALAASAALHFAALVAMGIYVLTKASKVKRQRYFE